MLTQHYGLIGFPLGYSLSPAMHHHFFQKEGILADYTSIPLHPEDLTSFVKSKRCAGFNVTIPYKELIFPLLGEISEIAQEIKAVNVVKWDQDHYVGTNTDAPGFSLMLKEDLGLSMMSLRVLLLGAGGAAKAITYAALNDGADRLYIYDNFPGKTEELLTQYEAYPPCLKGVQKEDLLPLLPNIDLVVNATPVGMKESLDVSLLSREELALLPDTATVVDIIYAPAETKLLRLSRERGLATLNGIGMLAGQGILGQDIWFEKSLPYAEAKALIAGLSQS